MHFQTKKLESIYIIRLERLNSTTCMSPTDPARTGSEAQLKTGIKNTLFMHKHGTKGTMMTQPLY